MVTVAQALAQKSDYTLMIYAAFLQIESQIESQMVAVVVAVVVVLAVMVAVLMLAI